MIEPSEVGELEREVFLLLLFFFFRLVWTGEDSVPRAKEGAGAVPLLKPLNQSIF
jgi:hypothetical protein